MRGRTKTSGWLAKCSLQQLEVALAAREVDGQLRICTTPNAADISDGSKFQPTSSKMNRSSYSRPSISEKKRLSPFCEPKNLTSLRRPHRRSSSARSTSASSSRHTMPPVPAAVMMCDSAKLVTRDVAARAGRRAAQRRAEAVAGVFDDLQFVRSAIVADAVPVGAVADEVGREDGSGARPDRGLDRVDVDLVRVGFDVDEHGHEPGADHRRDVGRERDRRRDDLVAGLEAEQLDGEVERRRTGVDHDAAPLAERRRRRAAPSRGRCLPMRSAVGPPRSTATTASISSSSWTLPAYSTRFMCGLLLSEERRAGGVGRDLVERRRDLGRPSGRHFGRERRELGRGRSRTPRAAFSAKILRRLASLQPANERRSDSRLYGSVASWCG